jgi:hypothetical protein
MALYGAKKDYLSYRDVNNQKFSVSDIIPLVNTAWDQIVARVDSSRKAIFKRGWNPLIYVLQDNPDLIRTNRLD